jgi:hypothetical protein
LFYNRADTADICTLSYTRSQHDASRAALPMVSATEERLPQITRFFSSALIMSHF